MEEHVDYCLLCGAKVVKKETGYKCSNPACTLEIPLILDGVAITHDMAKRLLNGKKISHLYFVSALGKKYKASLGLSEAGRLHKILG